MTHKLFNLHPCSLLIVTAREIKTLAASSTQLAWFWSSGDAAACAVRSAPTAPSARGGATTSRPVRHAPRERPSRRRACGACRARPRRAAGSRSAPQGPGARQPRPFSHAASPGARGYDGDWPAARVRRTPQPHGAGCTPSSYPLPAPGVLPLAEIPVPTGTRTPPARASGDRTQLQVTFAHLARFVSIIFPAKQTTSRRPGHSINHQIDFHRKSCSSSATSGRMHACLQLYLARLGFTRSNPPCLSV